MNLCFFYTHMFCYYSNRRSCIWGHVHQGLHSCLICMGGFGKGCFLYHLQCFLFKASKQKPVLLSALWFWTFPLIECSDGDTESCSFLMFFHILETLWLKFLKTDMLENWKNGASNWCLKEGSSQITIAFEKLSCIIYKYRKKKQKFLSHGPRMMFKA